MLKNRQTQKHKKTNTGTSEKEISLWIERSNKQITIYWIKGQTKLSKYANVWANMSMMNLNETYLNWPFRLEKLLSVYSFHSVSRRLSVAIHIILCPSVLLHRANGNVIFSFEATNQINEKWKHFNLQLTLPPHLHFELQILWWSIEHPLKKWNKIQSNL